ncbi:MAG TPA: VOC family protein [Thermoanaerobaculia bacterium]|nr:VOC family protein [Thermoanaerobaculia bacterium]
MSKLEVYLFFDGNCAEAMRFYESALGGKIEMMSTHAESPMAAEAPPGMADRIMHARLALDGQALMASDAMAGEPYEGMKNFSLSLSYPTAEEAKRIFGVLAEGGRVNMPIEKTFWSEAFGMLVDRFGTPWMVSGGPPIPQGS